MKQVLVKMPRPIAEKLSSFMSTSYFVVMADDEINRDEVSVIRAAIKDALASKPLDERTDES
jgi:hypothetical protein